MEELTREEINKRLEFLRNSRTDEKSYDVVRPAMAMCYCMRLEKTKYFRVVLKASYFGKECVKTIKITEDELRDIDIFDTDIVLDAEYLPEGTESHSKKRRFVDFNNDFNKKDESSKSEEFLKEKEIEETKSKIDIANEKIKRENYLKNNVTYISKFRNLGLDAKLEYDCCFAGVFKVLIKAKDEKDWHESSPKSLNNSEDGVTNLEYNYVLQFLSQQKTNKPLTYKDFNASRDDSGLIKTKVDMALQKVLELKIFYDKKEIEKNIKVLFKENNRESKIPLALEILKLKKSSDFENKLDNPLKIYHEYARKNNAMVSFDEFSKDFLNLEKKLLSSEERTKFLNDCYKSYEENNKNKKIESYEEYEKNLLENPDKLKKILEEKKQIVIGLYIIYQSKIGKGKTGFKSFEEFKSDLLKPENQKLSLDEYVNFMDGLYKVFDRDNDSKENILW